MNKAEFIQQAAIRVYSARLSGGNPRTHDDAVKEAIRLWDALPLECQPEADWGESSDAVLWTQHQRLKKKYTELEAKWSELMRGYLKGEAG